MIIEHFIDNSYVVSAVLGIRSALVAPIKVYFLHANLLHDDVLHFLLKLHKKSIPKKNSDFHIGI